MAECPPGQAHAVEELPGETRADHRHERQEDRQSRNLLRRLLRGSVGLRDEDLDGTSIALSLKTSSENFHARRMSE